MSDTLMIIVAIGLTVVLMFVFPLMTMADRTDDISQLVAQTAITEFVDESRTVGKLTQEQYDKLVETLSSTGNTYDIEIEISVLDENQAKKVTQAEPNKTGENEYYIIYTSQVQDKLDEDGELLLTEGSFISASAQNKNQTLSDQLHNFLYKVTGNDTYNHKAEASGMCTKSGK